jgi:hypothetical protein
LPAIIVSSPVESPCERRGLRLLRNALAASAGVILVVGLSAPAEAASRKPARQAETSKVGNRKEPPKLPFDGQAKGTLQIVVSIANQRLSLYSNGTKIGGAPVSTGTAAKPTPTGVFSIIEKDRYHHSNLYGDAPMYYMHRITWSGVAMHEGVLPGVPASHGCIRLPTEFVSKLWQVSKLGIRVIVSRPDVVPHDFEHPNLFVPREKPADYPASANLLIDGLRPSLAAASQFRPIQLAQATTTLQDAGAVEIPLPPPPAPAIEAIDLGPPPPMAPPIEAAEAPGAAARDVDTTATIKPEELKPAAPAAPALVETPKAADPIKPPELRLSAAEPEKSTIEVVDPPKPPARRGKGNTEPAKRTGQVAVFVSRKEKKVFVRKEFVPLFDMPVEIDHLDQPLGTHVFTALALGEGGSMRWNVMSMAGGAEPARDSDHAERDNRKTGKKFEPAPKPAVESKLPTAALALDRIHLPKEAVDRIGEILIPGSSLVISDQGLGSETGRMTEFIVLTK